LSSIPRLSNFTRGAVFSCVRALLRALTHHQMPWVPSANRQGRNGQQSLLNNFIAVHSFGDLYAKFRRNLFWWLFRWAPPHDGGTLAKKTLLISSSGFLRNLYINFHTCSRNCPDFILPNGIPKSKTVQALQQLTEKLSILNKIAWKCISTHQVWKIILFFQTNRPKNFLHTFPGWKMTKCFSRLRRNPAFYATQSCFFRKTNLWNCL